MKNLPKEDDILGINNAEFFDTPGEKKLTIVHLYPDLMNIYGDRGNIIALKQRLLWRNIDVSIVNVSIGDELPQERDLYFFGGGQDRSQITVAKDLQRLSKIIKNDIEDGVPALTICGGYQLFGHYYKDQNNQKLKGISIFDVKTIAGSKRMIGNVKIKTTTIIPNTEILGFENHSGETHLGKNMQPLGKVLKGFGNNPKEKKEGVVYKNAIGTYLHGSLLPKNPKLTDWFLEKALQRKYPDFKLVNLDDELENETFREAETRF